MPPICQSNRRCPLHLQKESLNGIQEGEETPQESLLNVDNIDSLVADPKFPPWSPRDILQQTGPMGRYS
jgi:hypothetical protein